MDVKTVGCGREHVFFISGMFANGWIWDPVVSFIDKEKYTAHIMQPALCEIDSNFDALCDVIVKLIKKIDQPVVLVGNSLGGFLALKIASEQTVNVVSVVVSGSPGHGMVDLGVGRPDPSSRQFALAFRSKIFYDESCIPEEDFKKAINLWQNRRSFINIIRLMKHANAINAEDVVKRVRCKVIAIWGEHDVITPPSYFDRICCNLGHMFCKIPQSGHSPMYEKPREFYQYMNLA